MTDLDAIARNILADDDVDMIDGFDAIRPTLTEDETHTLALMLELCPVHFCDFRICTDDENTECFHARSQVEMAGSDEGPVFYGQHLSTLDLDRSWTNQAVNTRWPTVEALLNDESNPFTLAEVERIMAAAHALFHKLIRDWMNGADEAPGSLLYACVYTAITWERG